MRILLLLLLLANLLFFGWSAGLMGETTGGREPQRLEAQLRPEAIQLLAPGAGVPVPLCKRLDGLTVDSINALRGFLDGREAFSLESRSEPAPPVWWVAVAALPTQAAAQKRLADLRARVGEGDVLPDAEHGPYVVRVAEFADAARARERLAELDAKPPRTGAQVVEHRAADIAVGIVRIAPSAPQAAGDLAAWVATQPGLKLADCPVP